MNRNVILTAIILVFFSTWSNSLLTYATFNTAPKSHSKSALATSRSIWVPDNHTRIQQAIDNATAGDTIFVRAGTYYEHVTIDKSISLIGENKHNTIIDGNGTGIVVSSVASNINLSGFTIQNGEWGIWLWRSANSIFTGNTASNNQYGIYIWKSSDNILTSNIASNNQYGIYLDGSGYNALISNNVSSNDNNGIRLTSSGNNVLSGNIASNNQYGIYLDRSRNNIVTGNTVTKNDYGIRLTSFSDNNALTGNNVSSNDNNGIRLTSSSNNMIYHNNLIDNTESASSIDSVNSWGYRAEGNYWSDYDGTDANVDGIGETPYPIDENNQDNYPLMATFLQFTIVEENQSYKIDAVSSSTISNFQYRYDPDSRTDAISFKVNGVEGKGFCRISIAHTLIEPPYTAKVDQKSPLYFGIVSTNGTHTWLYFTYYPLEHEVTIMHKLYPEQLVLYQWAILGLSAIIVVLLLINIHYYRIFKEQKKVIQAYERELGSFPVSHSERARLRFVKDVIERKEKIEKFKKKYGIKIQPAGTLEDLMEKLGTKKKVNR